MAKQADAVFSGGGIKGIAYAGAMQAAEEAGWGDWQHLAGTSAGGIAAAALALGYDAAGLRSLFSYDFSKLDDEILGFIPNYFGHAVTLGNGLTTFINQVVTQAPVKATTFGDLPDGKLQVVGSDLVYQRMLVFPRDADLYINPATGQPWLPADFPIELAVRISAGYPGFFPPVALKDAATGQDGQLVDGGVTSSMPVFLFDQPNPKWPTWGFELYGGPPNNQISGPFWPIGMVEAVIDTGINTLDDYEIAAFGHRIVQIPTGSVSALDFGLTQAQKDELYNAGYDAAKQFFVHPDPTNRFGAEP